MTTLTDLRALGFRRIEDFQRAWNLGPALKPDGIIGPKTLLAVKESTARHHAGEGDISAHFSASEFSCKCGGKLTGCRKTLVRRELLDSLEKLRAHFEITITIVSGYRCPKHNDQVKGAEDSQHLHGTAADTEFNLNLAQVKGQRLFAGIGSKRSLPHRVTHVDRRDIISGHDATVSNPDLWYYAG